MSDSDRRLAVLHDPRGRFRSEPHRGPRFHLARVDRDEDGTLTLAGEVPGVAAGKRALECAASHEAVRATVDRVHVTPAAPMGDATPELALAAGVPATAADGFDIEIRGGVVTLTGHVPGLTARRLAGVMAWWVPGVRDVVNGLEVAPPEEDSPIAIEDAVRDMAERDA